MKIARSQKPVATIGADDHGSVMVEAALTLPFVMLMGFATFEFANFMSQHQAMTTGVRDAARYLARVSIPYSAVGANLTCADAIANRAETARNIAVTGAPNGDERLRVAGWTAAQVTITTVTQSNSAGAYRGGDPLCVVRVSGSLPYAQFGLLRALRLGAPTVAVSHSERWVGD